jgi:PAS domain S-box-containing protein
MSDATHNDLAAFTEAYTAFNSALEKLASSQRNLESHFTTLNQQLQDTNGRLQTSLEEESRLNAYLESMLEGLGSGIVAVDTENRVTLVNEAAVDLIGCRPESVLHEPAKALLGEAADLLSLTMSAGDGTTETEQDLTVAGDRTLPVRFKTACLRSRDGTILGALAIIDDVSHVRELSRQASRVNTLTALGEMSATVAHEIRNPLGGIGGFADVLARKLDADDPRRRLVIKITEGIDRLNSVVSNLLTYTRPAQLNLRPVDFVEVVEDCVGFFEIDAGSRVDEIEVQRDYTIPQLPCRIDPEQIQQIVLNLLHNAVQAIPGSGWVRIRVRSEENAAGLHEWDEMAAPSSTVAVLSVADSGIGMSSDVQSKLFRPFFTTKEDGNGLGLATAKKIIEAHGGAINVQSEPRKGTEFSVILPVG